MLESGVADPELSLLQVVGRNHRSRINDGSAEHPNFRGCGYCFHFVGGFAAAKELGWPRIPAFFRLDFPPFLLHLGESLPLFVNSCDLNVHPASYTFFEIFFGASL